MENKEKKITYYKLLIATAVIIPLIISFTYAYYLPKVKGNATSISGKSIEEFNFNLITENDGYITASHVAPLRDDYVNLYANLGTFKIVSGNNKLNIKYEISLINIEISSGLTDSIADLKWSITCTSTSCKNDTAKNVSGDFTSINNNELTLATNLVIEPNTTDEYELRIWIAETDEDQSSIMNQSFSAKIKTVGEFILS
jgi:hypothetical protein